MLLAPESRAENLLLVSNSIISTIHGGEMIKTISRKTVDELGLIPEAGKNEVKVHIEYLSYDDYTHTYDVEISRL